MQKDRETLVLYTTAVCNLNCSYCYIDKNPALKKIDDILDESFKGDYYFDFTKRMFPRQGQLKRIETWGGEPFLRMDRVYGTLHRIIRHYPFFEEMHSSTNYAFPDWPEQFFGLMEQFGQYPDRRFKYLLQLSSDGPQYITDKGRGAGTSAQCMKNFKTLVDGIGNRLPPNVELTVTFKPTLDLESTKLLCDEVKLIEYYQFFEGLVEMLWNLGYSNIRAFLPVPNTACPSPVTKEDGILFAELCRLCRKIERENIERGHFKYYQCITPFATNTGEQPLTYQYPNFTCGTGRTIIGLLPGEMISACHNGFVDLASDYKKQVTANHGESTIDFGMFLNDNPMKLTMDLKNFETYERQAECYACPNTTARLSNIVSMINILAYAGQIDERYKSQEEALNAGIFIQSHTAYCIRDNYNTTGMMAAVPVGLLKLLLNGAKEHIENRGCKA